MTKTLKLTVAFLGFALLFGTSCKKYEEGPGISLRSKTSRISNTWTIDKNIDSDGTTREFTQEEKDAVSMTIDKDGTYTFTSSYVLLGQTVTTTEKGTWEFTDGKEKVKRTKENGSTDEMTIILLKNKELGFLDSDGDKAYYVEK